MRGLLKFIGGCLVLGVVGVLAVAGIGFGYAMTNDTETLTTSETRQLDGATRVEARIDTGAGDITIGSALPAMETVPAGTVMEADFRYPEDQEPTVSYDVSGETGELSIGHDDRDGFRQVFDFVFGDEASWDIALTQEVPVSLEIDMGAGDTDLNLAGIDVAALDIDSGAGDATIDLSGVRTGGFSGSIDMGVGDVDILVPEDIGVRVTVDQGAGDVSESDDFSRDGDTYTNAAWETADVRVELTIDTGAGDISLETI